MRIIHRNASALLFEKVHSLENAYTSWRCIHLNLSSQREQYSQMLRTYFIIKGLTETLNDNDGTIYLCNDGDIFILFQGMLRPVMARLAHYFGDIDLSRATQKAEHSFFTIYDLSKDWAHFLNLCFTKSLIADTFDESPYYALGEVLPASASDALQEN